MAVAFSWNASNNGSGTATSLTENAAAASNDIILALITTQFAVTATPTGWTKIGATLTLTGGSANNSDMELYWIRRGAGAPSYVWTVTSGTWELNVWAYTGVLTAGDPTDGSSTYNPGTTGTTVVQASFSTGTANSMAVAMGWDFGQGGGVWTVDNGFTNRGGDTAAVNSAGADKLIVAAGAIGTTTQTDDTASSETRGGFMTALKVAGAATVNRPDALFRGIMRGGMWGGR